MIITEHTDIALEWLRFEREYERKRLNFITKLKACGIRAAFPHDGWVDFDRNCLRSANPIFWDCPLKDELIVIGSYFDKKFRLFRVTRVEENKYNDANNIYFFEEVYDHPIEDIKYIYDARNGLSIVSVLRTKDRSWFERWFTIPWYPEMKKKEIWTNLYVFDGLYCSFKIPLANPAPV